MRFLAKLLSAWVPVKSWRKRLRAGLEKVFLCSAYCNIWVLQARFKAVSVGKSLRLGGKSKFNAATYLGDYVSFNGIEVIGKGKFRVGSYCCFGKDIFVVTSNHNYESTEIPYDETNIAKDVEVGECCWIGSRVMILPGTKIGEGAVIQGGAVVHGEIPPYAVAGGNPAKVFKYRNIENYQKLKLEGKFFIDPAIR